MFAFFLKVVLVAAVAGDGSDLTEHPECKREDEQRHQSTNQNFSRVITVSFRASVRVKAFVLLPATYGTTSCQKSTF